MDNHNITLMRITPHNYYTKKMEECYSNKHRKIKVFFGYFNKIILRIFNIGTNFYLVAFCTPNYYPFYLYAQIQPMLHVYVQQMNKINKHFTYI